LLGICKCPSRKRGQNPDQSGAIGQPKLETCYKIYHGCFMYVPIQSEEEKACRHRHRKIFGRYINTNTSGGRRQVDLNKLGWYGVGKCEEAKESPLDLARVTRVIKLNA